MEIFFELLFTVGLSVLVSFILAELLSMMSSSDVAADDVVLGSRMDVVEKRVFHAQKQDQNLVVCDFESEKNIGFFGGVGKFNDREDSEFQVICDNEEVSREVGVLGFEKKSTEVKDGDIDTREVKKDKVSVGGDDVEQKLADESSMTATFREIEIELETGSLVEESPERLDFREIEIGLIKGVRENENDGVKSNDVDGYDDEKDGSFDDWEGIERSELEKRFGAAVVFVGSKNNAALVSGLESDVRLLLYGLQKVALEGPCLKPQPMALKVSARAKWNAWQRLGNMSREVAMEQHIALLSRCIPGWIEDDTSGDGKQVFQSVGTSGNLTCIVQKQPGAESEGKSEGSKPGVEECHAFGVEVPAA